MGFISIFRVTAHHHHPHQKMKKNMTGEIHEDGEIMTLVGTKAEVEEEGAVGAKEMNLTPWILLLIQMYQGMKSV